MAPQCCHLPAKPPRLLRRFADAVACLASGIALAAMPKCPICLAAYFTMATGLGLSVAMARSVQWSLTVLCAILWLYVAARLFSKLKHGRKKQ